MIGGKQIGGQRPGGRNQDGSGTTKSPPRSGNYCVCLVRCTQTPCRTHFSDTISLRGVQTARTRTAQGVCSVHAISLRLTLSILMLFPDGHSETTFPTLTSALSMPNCSRSESAGQAHFRTSGAKFGYLTDPQALYIL